MSAFDTYDFSGPASQPPGGDGAGEGAAAEPENLVVRSESVQVRRIEIHRALGIRQGEGFVLPDMCSGVNLVFGPNGSGKSTTCKVVQEVLWPGTLPRPSVSGVINDPDGEWHIDIDAGHVQVHRHGRAAGLPDFGSPEKRSRYHLGLSDLIIDRNDKQADFAKAVAEASQGGYDLERAAEKLGFRRRTRSRKQECDDLHETEAALEQAQQAQSKIAREADRIVDLRQKLDEAEEAVREHALLTIAKEYHTAAVRCRKLTAERDAYPLGVTRLLGGERAELDSLSDEESRLLRQQSAEEGRRQEAERKLADLHLPERGVGEDRLRELRALVGELENVEAKIDEQRRYRDEANGRAESALRKLGRHFTGEQLAHIESIEETELCGFSRRVHRLRAKESLLKERSVWLDREEPGDIRSLSANDLRDGIAALTHWLSSPPHPGDQRYPGQLSGAAALLLALVAGILATMYAGWWLIALLVAIILISVDFIRNRRRRNADGHNRRAVYEQSYATLSLPLPESWTDERVAARLRDLSRWAAVRALHDERQTKLDELRADQEALEAFAVQIDRERRSLEELLGFRLDIEDEWLPLIVDQVQEWQSATMREAGAEEALSASELDRAEVIGQIDPLLTAYGYRAPGSSKEAAEYLSDLERRCISFKTAAEAIQGAAERLDRDINPALETISVRRKELLGRLGLHEDDETQLDEWIALHPSYCELVNRIMREEAVRDERASALAGRCDFIEIGATEVEIRLADCRSRADSCDGLRQAIWTIEKNIDGAKLGHELTEALERRDDARAALSVGREEDGRALVGSLLTDWVRREAVERSRPKVFKRANELFVRFTRGTLSLEMDDHASPPEFVARRGNLPCQALDELSDGERIQLMTAVRLAFVEQDESKRLPLLVDEVLGTSDDGRSGVLIDTMIDIARQGRQVFYCTAQHDEIGKWKARLKEVEVPFRIIDLGEIRKGMTCLAEPLEIAVFRTPEPPNPAGMSYDEYGLALGVPPIDPTADSIDRVHLWHVLDDPQLIFELLRKDISTWGQLETLLEHGGAGLVQVRERTFDRAVATARAIKAACEAMKIGRGRRVDRAVLLASECVSDRFIDEVTGLAKRVEGDAARIIRSLDEREISNWRSDNTEKLRDYFEGEGYLPLQPSLSPQDVRVRTVARVADELESGVIEMETIERVMAKLFSTLPAEQV